MAQHRNVVKNDKIGKNKNDSYNPTTIKPNVYTELGIQTSRSNSHVITLAICKNSKLKHNPYPNKGAPNG